MPISNIIWKFNLGLNQTSYCVVANRYTTFKTVRHKQIFPSNRRTYYPGAIAGVIFVIIVSIVKKFAIINFKRGITEGVIYSIIIFIVLFIPTTLGMVLPNLFDIMNQSNPTQSNLEDRQTVEQNLIPIYGFGFIAHVIFGIILGFVTSLLLFRRYIILNK